jgi:hypothetical protein
VFDFDHTQYFGIVSRLRQALRQDGGKRFPFLELSCVDGRDKPRDKPSHDGAD